MSSKKTLRQILEESDKCFLVPCVYDCASNRAVEMCGFPVRLLSGGEVSISLNGVIDYGFTNLTDLEWVVSQGFPDKLHPADRGYRGWVWRTAGGIPFGKKAGCCGAAAIQ